MNVYLVIDMEGIGGVTHGSMIRTGHVEWRERGTRLMTAEANAAIEGAFQGGATSVIVKDGHDSGQNIRREDLDSRAELITGNSVTVGLMPGMDSTFDKLFLMGFHAKMGTRFGQFDHTISTATISNLSINDIVVGEIGLYGIYAGFYDVSVALTTGDGPAVEESQELFGDHQGVAVKQGLGRFAVRTFNPDKILTDITQGAKKAMNVGAPPMKVESPVSISIDFLRSAEADMAEMVPGSVRTSARNVQYTHSDPDIAFQGLQAMVSLAGVAASRWASGLYKSGDAVV
ncbi:MAG: hypothetical protein CMQ51_08170 [Gammaproteobacteria bacterium]|nr:hypothetical protein [Gammaproteobacteria bacterium]|tara:strand:+ start:118 stop:981 length:864 start_codon:yes stop_codon:yes gene_type:complete